MIKVDKVRFTKEIKIIIKVNKYPKKELPNKSGRISLGPTYPIVKKYNSTVVKIANIEDKESWGNLS